MNLNFKSWFLKHNPDPVFPQIPTVRFTLLYEELPVGFLFFEEGMWNFEYSEEFKAQSHLQPLINFPDKEQRYTGESLPPFFESRLPSPSNPRIQKIMDSHGVKRNDKAEMLKLFGRRTLTNAFVLQPGW